MILYRRKVSTKKRDTVYVMIIEKKNLIFNIFFYVII